MISRVRSNSEVVVRSLWFTQMKWLLCHLVGRSRSIGCGGLGIWVTWSVWNGDRGIPQKSSFEMGKSWKMMENHGKWWKMMENDHKPLENRWILRINLETPLTIGKPLLNGCWGALFNPYFLKGDRCRLAQDPDSSGLKGTANLGSLLWNFGQIIGRKKRTS